MSTSCHACGASLRIEGPVGRRSLCPECDAELHACLNCRHHDPSAPHQCREPHADPVVDKAASNPCDLFQMGDGASRREGAGAEAARRALAALFGEAPARPESPADAAEALFGKRR